MIDKMTNEELLKEIRVSLEGQCNFILDVSGTSLNHTRDMLKVLLQEQDDHIQDMLNHQRLDIAEQMVEIVADNKLTMTRIATKAFIAGHRANVNGIPHPQKSLETSARDCAKRLIDHDGWD